MTKQEIDILHDSFCKIKEYVNKYRKNNYRVQLRFIDELLNSLEEESTNDNKQENNIVYFYSILYPPYGGLSDFYIPHSDYKTRIKLNKPLNEINDRVWAIMKLYI